ncbi:MAG: sugar transferase [Candidatus Doudnabacteria bacterium]|nr:sugar transferase [Candidatus Doudnabacteria bacterium]
MSHPSTRTTSYNVVKRTTDICASAIALLVLSPLLAAIALWIKLDSTGPVLFTQKRVGCHKKLFTIYKFRSMSTDAPKDVATHTLQNASAHITRAGRFLRKSSLDELPQLINILRGDMSVVGPRPALYNQDDLIAERDKYGANDIRPGLTGWAQVNGRDELPIPIKAKLDGIYTERYGVDIDLHCIYMTIAAVLTNKGVQEGANSDEQ